MITSTSLGLVLLWLDQIISPVCLVAPAQCPGAMPLQRGKIHPDLNRTRRRRNDPANSTKGREVTAGSALMPSRATRDGTTRRHRSRYTELACLGCFSDFTVRGVPYNSKLVMRRGQRFEPARRLSHSA